VRSQAGLPMFQNALTGASKTPVSALL